MNKEEIIITPIGYVHSDLTHRYETPRQGILAGKNISVVELIQKNNFQQALKELDGFDRIWILYQFHLNNNWNPMVTPPRHTRKKVGVFATRAPYRPNQIGMSCVKLERIDGLKIFISESDILDGSPVLDIKPYLPYSDSFPNAKTGWVKKDYDSIYKIILKPKAKRQCDWLRENAKINLENFAKLQLEFYPTDNTRKRITISEKKEFILAYRTWRIFYTVNSNKQTVTITEIRSGYNEAELYNEKENKYQDKLLHQLFRKRFKL